MGLFNKFKTQGKQTDDYLQFSTWLDNVLEAPLPEDIAAFNFNLYEGASGTYDIQLIGAEEFDEDDEDWVCTDYFTSGEDICYVKRTKEIEDWQDGLKYASNLVSRYLSEGKYADKLKDTEAVGIGFIDGDVELLYRK